MCNSNYMQYVVLCDAEEKTRLPAEVVLIHMAYL